MGIDLKIKYEDLKRDIKNIGGFKIILTVLFLIIFFIAGSLVSPHLPWMKEVGPANVSQNIYIPITPETSKPSSCEERMFEDKLSDWTIKYYNQADKDGFYCPRVSSPYPSPDIWYKSSILTKFNSLEIRYNLKNKNNSTSTPPTFIFSIGDSPKILRLYIAERNPQIVGFEKIIKEGSTFSTKREAVRTLDDPIEYGTEAELKVRIIISGGNKATFYFNLIYISALDGRSVENSFNYDVDLPFPKPESELSKLKIGFGTFKENCVKPISYKFCY